MIYSRSPEQYDPKPFIDAAGKRYGWKDAPAGTRERARKFFAPSEDSNPVMDSFTGERLTKQEALELVDRSPGDLVRLTWDPRDREYHSHNVILSSLRLTSAGKKLTLESINGWLATLESLPLPVLLAIGPGLDRDKVEEAREVLSRLARLSSEEKGR